MRRLRSLSEAECYARCYGAADETVRVIRPVPRARRRMSVSGETLRARFEQLLEARDPGEAVEAA